MPSESATIAAESCREAPASPAGKLRLIGLGDIDGRTAAARNTRRLLADLIAQLGGEDAVSPAERELATRAAIMGAMLADAEAKWLLGEGLALADYLPLANAHRRALQVLGLERRARRIGVTLDDYLAGKGVAA